MKRPYYHDNAFDLGGCFALLAVWLIPAFLMSFWTHSNINQWLVFAGKTNECPYWLALIPSLFFGPSVFVPNFISEIIQLFLF